MDTERSPQSLDDVRLAILRQHTQLSQLLDELEANADAVLAKGGNGDALRRSLDALERRFLRHMEYEDSLGTATKAALGDHTEKRTRMKGLVHDRDVFGDPCGLAREARAFVHAFRRDIADEAVRLRTLG